MFRRFTGHYQDDNDNTTYYACIYIYRKTYDDDSLYDY